MYVLCHNKIASKAENTSSAKKDKHQLPLKWFGQRNEVLDEVQEYMMDPVSGNNAQGRAVSGIVCIHVDDLFLAGDKHFVAGILASLRKDFQVGSEDKDDVMFVGQRIRWTTCRQSGRSYIKIDQERCIEELGEVSFDKSLKDSVELTPQLHTEYRSVSARLIGCKVVHRYIFATSSVDVPPKRLILLLAI